MKNGIIVDGKVYELVKVEDKTHDCKGCDLFQLCHIDGVKAPCMSFVDYKDKHFKLRKEDEKMQ